MMKYIVYFMLCSIAIAQPSMVWNRPDGSVAITYPVWSAQASGETTSAFLARIQADVPTSITSGTVAVVIDRSLIPWQDRYFRDAWRLNSGHVSIQRLTAQAIHRKNLIQRMREKLQNGTIGYLQADAVLRSIQSMDLSTATAPTLQSLKSTMPTVLTTP
jgi:hypothetical protein